MNEKKKISLGDYHSLLGLKTLADINKRQADEIQNAIASIIGEKKDKYGYYETTSDWYYDDSSVETLLDCAEVEVDIYD